MKVELLSCTPDALNLLLRTKGTRLAHADDPSQWSEQQKLDHLAYMRDTIQSSWEFVVFVFRISGVSRSFTHQLVRTRHGSYAQESQRTVDVRDHDWEPLKGGNAKQREGYDVMMRAVLECYAQLADEGVPVQHARELLPTGLHTSIIAQYSLRTLHDMAEVRLCTRTQGQYQDVFRAMKQQVVAVYPWAEPFIRVACANTGVCIFPRYTQCPIQKHTYNGSNPKQHAATLALIQRHAETDRHEATPKATGGKTQ